MQSAAQLVLHVVVQSSVAGMVTHCVSQWSLQHAPHDAWQSVMSADDEQLALHPAEQRPLQSVLHVVEPGLAVHVVVQSLRQLDVHVASALRLHWLSHCCSSFAAQHASKLVGVHIVVHALVVTSWQLALASMSMSPHAEMPAWARRGAIVSAATPRARMEAERRVEIGRFISAGDSNR